MRPARDETGTGEDILRLALPLPLFRRTSSLACLVIVMGSGALLWALFASPLLLIHEALSLL